MKDLMRHLVVQVCNQLAPITQTTTLSVEQSVSHSAMNEAVSQACKQSCNESITSRAPNQHIKQSIHLATKLSINQSIKQINQSIRQTRLLRSRVVGMIAVEQNSVCRAYASSFCWSVPTTSPAPLCPNVTQIPCGFNKA